jgi:hypothetical protein
MHRLFVVFAVLQGTASSAQEQVPVGVKAGVDSRALVEALASFNPAPRHVGTRHYPVFDAKFDWREHDRAWEALELLIQNAEFAWPELVNHLDDERYCVTYKSFSGFTLDFTVGGACREVILQNLAYGYFKTVRPGSKEAYLRLQTPGFLRDPVKLKAWCEARRNRKLYELQIEICDWAAAELAKPEEFPKEDLDTRNRWIAAIQKASESLRKSQTAVLWTGFGREERIPYSRERADAIALRIDVSQAEEGDFDAMLRAGLAFLSDEDAENNQDGIKWLEMSSAGGNATADYHLGAIYQDGVPVKQDTQKAILYLTVAAELGEIRAMNRLGGIYYNGELVPANDVLALKWALCAAGLGSKTGQKNVEQMRTQIDKRSADSAAKAAEAWLKRRHPKTTE